MKKIIVITLFVLAVIVALCLVRETSDVFGNEDAGGHKAQLLEETFEETERLEVQSAENLARLERLRMAAKLSKKEGEESPETPPMSPVQVQQAVDNVEKILEEGQRDSAWEEQVTRAAQAALEKAEVRGVAVYKTRCSGGVCGVDLKCDGADAFNTLAQTKLDGPWSKSEAFATASTIEDQLGMRIYFSKEGTDLPVDEDMVLPPM